MQSNNNETKIFDDSVTDGGGDFGDLGHDSIKCWATGQEQDKRDRTKQTKGPCEMKYDARWCIEETNLEKKDDIRKTKIR